VESIGDLQGCRQLALDVTDEASMQAAVDVCIASFGAIHGLVNCAGVAPGERVVGRNGPHSLAHFTRTVMINLVGTFNAIRLAAAKMSVQPAFANGERGVIVNTSSVASFEGQIGQAGYSASKAGVNGMTLPVARELAKFGIRVMTIAPGIFDTPMLQGMSEEVRASLGQQVPFPPRRPRDHDRGVRPDGAQGSSRRRQARARAELSRRQAHRPREEPGELFVVEVLGLTRLQ
jgi:NAD(P)-dependent dehydrogenase (short-subunit alcohol dehydrogenase family)